VKHPNGAVVPAEPIGVQAARADHLAAKGVAAADAYASGYGYGGYAHGLGLAGHGLGLGVAAGHGLGLGVAGHGLGLGLAGHGAGLIGHGAGLIGHGLVRKYVGPVAATYPAGAKGLVKHPNGAVVPAEPIGVQAARADHLAAKGVAAANAYASGYGYAGYGHGLGLGYGHGW